MFPALSTTRFNLTQITSDDLEFIFAGLSDPVAMPYNGVYYETLESTSAQLEWYDKNYREGTGTAWKITGRNSVEKIGVISYYHHKPEHRKAEVGFWLLPKFWNQGITSEVLQAVIIFCQSEKNIHRLEASVEEENIASKRVLLKNNFMYEGTMRECELKFGRFISLEIYSLLKG